MQLGFNLWAWTWCNISRPRKSGTLGSGTGGTGGTCGTRCPGTFAFLERKEFREPVHLNAWGSTGSKPPLGSNTHGSTGSIQVPHRFHTGSTQVPHRFLGFNRGTVGIVEGVNFGNCPNYVVLNAPLRCTIFGMGGDVFLTGMPFTNRNHATGSTGSQQVPWVQPRHWFHSSRQVPWVQTRNGSTGSRQVLWVQLATGSTGSRQVPWVQPRRWFHRFHTGSLGSNTQWFHRFHTGSLGSTRHWFHRFQTGSLGSTTLWVQQVEPKEPVWNRPRHSFHRFQTGSLGSTVELWELWRVWITKQWFCVMYR